MLYGFVRIIFEIFNLNICLFGIKVNINLFVYSNMIYISNFNMKHNLFHLVYNEMFKKANFPCPVICYLPTYALNVHGSVPWEHITCIREKTL